MTIFINFSHTYRRCIICSRVRGIAHIVHNYDHDYVRKKRGRKKRKKKHQGFKQSIEKAMQSS